MTTEWPGLDEPWSQRFATAVARVGQLAGLELDARELLLERAELEGRVPRGAVSTGGACRLLAAGDGPLAVNLPRATDVELLPAWLGLAVEADAADWELVASQVATRTVADLVRQADLCGLAVAAPRDSAAVDEQLAARGQGRIPEPFLITPGGAATRSGSPRVVDLSAMWAGPLCGALLAEAGAKVAKVESVSRPDPRSDLYERLNSSKERFGLRLDTPSGLDELRGHMADADVVIESARPRVMAQWGIDPESFVAAGGVWVSITAYGRTGPWSNRPGFGDDTAVAGGLYLRQGPQFVGDAVADPVTGVFSALAALGALAGGTGALVDIAMREAVAHVVGDDRL